MSAKVINNSKSEALSKRSYIIDFVRGLSVFLMVVFHFFFDLNLWGFVKFDMVNPPFWFAYPRVVIFMFLFVAGMSLKLTHPDHIRWSIFWKRFLKIAFFAVLISVGTYFFAKDNWIYFGTLHAIAIISLMSLPFLYQPKLALIVSLIILIPSIFFKIDVPFILLPHISWDYVPPFPWVAASLMGIYAVSRGIHKIQIPENKYMTFFISMGKHSLVIYLLHQPVLFGLMYALSLMK